MLLTSTVSALPGGPGSIDGFGGDYARSAANGMATYSIPIEVPAGAGGLTPELSLQYEGGGGISELGLGFSFGALPRIRLRTEEGLPRFDGSDTYEIVGFGASSDLQPIGRGFYRPEYEAGQFVRVQRGPSFWEARDKSGFVYRFGQQATVEAEDERVAAWLLTERSDVYGHRIAYAWDTSSGFARLTSITWNDYDAKVRNTVSIVYEPRPDVHTLYSSGIKRVLDRRVTAIAVTHGGSVVRKYELRYAEAKVSLLAQVTLVGSDETSRLPATRFDYTDLTVVHSGQATTMQSAPGVSPSVASTAITDLNGDGLPDFLVGEAGAYRSYLNLDGKAWAPGSNWGAASPSSTLNTRGVSLADIDADGTTDLTLLDASGFRYLPGIDDSGFGAAVASETAPSVPAGADDTRLSDVNGDARADFLTLSSSGLSIVYNLGGHGWSSPESFGPVDDSQVLAFSDGRTTLCDINGDHIDDLCHLVSGSLRYWLGRGYGRFEPGQSATGVPRFDPTSPFQLHDLDGDGWCDLVHVGVNRVEVALAKAAGAFDTLQSITSTVTTSTTTQVAFEDLNGSGTSDVLWVDGAVAGGATWKYLELFPQGRGGLLRRVDNGRGRIQTFRYGTAAEDAAAARADGKAWSSRINYAMPVLRGIEIDRSVGDPLNVTEFVYRDGTYSPAERTFAGFASVVERTLGDATQPTLVTETVFDTGLLDRNLRGQPLRVEHRDEAGTIFEQTATRYTTIDLELGGEARARYSYASQQERTAIEGTDMSAARSTRTEWQEDAFGNITQESEWGEVEGTNLTIGHDERTTLRTFANNTDDWLLGFLTSEEILDESGKRARFRRVFYDGEDFQGLPLGEVARGNATREEAWVGPSAQSFQLLVARAFDADGHVVETRDALGGGKTFEWDTANHTFLRAEHQRVSGSSELVQTSVFDAAFGVMSVATAWNGASTHFEYDVFGRPTAVIAAGDSRDQPTLRTRYEDTAPLSRVVHEARVRSGDDATERTEVVIDGDGRARASFARLADGRWVLSGRVLYNAAGEPRKRLQASYVGDKELKSPPLQADGAGLEEWCDAKGRTIRTKTAMGAETRIQYGAQRVQRWEPGQAAKAGPYEHTPTTFEYDGLGRVIERSETLSGKPVVARYGYDATGALMTRTDPEGGVSHFTYDALGRRTSLQEPTVGKYTFAYDLVGNRTRVQRPDGTTQRFTFDLAGRLLTEDWDGDGKHDATRRWDTHAGDEEDLNGKGKLTFATDPSGSTALKYDARGRPIESLQIIGETTYRTGIGYDAQNRAIRRVFPDNSTLSIAYDARGLISAYGELAKFEYDADGQETRRSLQGGVEQTRTFDEDLRLVSERVTGPKGRVIQAIEWTFDEAGNVDNVRDRRPDIDAAHDRSESYAYDNLYRLVRASGTWGNMAWAFSGTGNTLEQTSTVDSLDEGVRTYGADGRPQALARSRDRKVAYDALGRMLDDGERVYTWSARDMAESVEGPEGARVDNVYDAVEQRRIREETHSDGSTHSTHFIDAWTESEDGKLVRYLVKDGRRFARLDSADDTLAAAEVSAAAMVRLDESEPVGPREGLLVLVLCGALWFALSWIVRTLERSDTHRFPALLALGALALAALQCGGSDDPGSDPDSKPLSRFGEQDRLLFSDALGSLTEVTTPDGEPLAAFAAYPGGRVRYDTTEETRRYANSPYDASVGVAAMGARLYVPDLSVWASVDPDATGAPDRFVGEAFVEANAYAYANDNATNGTDESGHGFRFGSNLARRNGKHAKRVSPGERTGGHAWEKHVGKSTQWLRSRLEAEGIGAASTFVRASDAERVVEAVSTAAGSELRRALGRGGHGHEELTFAMAFTEGRVLERGAAEVVASRYAVVVFRRFHRPGAGRVYDWRVVTAFPTLAPDAHVRIVEPR